MAPAALLGVSVGLMVGNAERYLSGPQRLTIAVTCLICFFSAHPIDRGAPEDRAAPREGTPDIGTPQRRHAEDPPASGAGPT